MALTITESWILDKVKLQQKHIDDVKSLALPGSYNEKIAHLGNALKGFSRLKHLDLSKNCVSILDGLDHLDLLETLNLYYNNVASLKELFKLHNNKHLKELDLRLNPVTKNEPDYRLFIIHMLPDLRILDDRSVRDSERRAALSHFTTSQATEFEDVPAENSTENRARSQAPRAKLVKSLASKQTALDDEDMVVLDLIRRRHFKENNDTFAPGRRSLQTSPTAAQQPMVEVYSRPELEELDYKWREEFAPADRLPTTATTTSERQPLSHFSYDAHATFTPNPRLGLEHASPVSSIHASDHIASVHLSKSNGNGGRRDSEQEVEQASSRGRVSPIEAKTNCARGRSESVKPAVIDLLTLVDKYWNGTRSLHSNEKFLALASHVLVDLIEAAAKNSSARHDVSPLKLENERLQGELSRTMEQCTQAKKNCDSLAHENDVLRQRITNEADIKRTLEAANDDLSSLRDNLRQLQEENRNLKTNARSSRVSEDALAALKAEFAVSKQSLEKREEEISMLRKQSQHQCSTTAQLQELTSMLQESHRSLVVTNDHLLQEIDEARHRHQQEVQQLHWSYKQLKGTASWLPASFSATGAGP